MEKVIVFLRRNDSEKLEDFSNRYLNEHTKQVLTEIDPVKYVANLVEDKSNILIPQNRSLPYEGVDAVDELWFETEGYLPELYKNNLQVIEAYRISERVVQQCLPCAPKGQRTPWFKRLNFTYRKEGMSFEEYSSHWINVHAPLALKNHNTLQYFQNLVLGSLTDVPSKWDGLAEIYFRSEDDFVNRLFVSPEAKQIIMEDARQYTGLGEGPRLSLILAEYIQR